MTPSLGKPRGALALLPLCVAQLLAGPGASAQTAPPFPQLFRETVDAPRRVELDADIERAQALAQQARARANPTLNAFTENVGGRSPYRGLDRAEHTLQLSQPLDLFGKRSARAAAADAGVTAARARSAEGRLQYAFELARAYGEAEVAQRRVAMAEGEVDAADADLKVARALVAAGKEARLRSLQAETEVNALRAALESARAQSVGTYARLAALAGRATPYVGVSASLLDGAGAGGATSLPDAGRNAAYIAARAEREEALRRVDVAARQARPDVSVSLGIRRFEAEDAHALVAGVSLPLPLFDRNRGNVAAAQAEVRRADARAAAALLQANAEIRTAHALSVAADARVAAAARTLQTAQETYRLARIAYDAGKSPLIELIAARRGLGDARSVVLDALTARLDARTRLARQQGLTISGDRIP